MIFALQKVEVKIDIRNAEGCIPYDDMDAIRRAGSLLPAVTIPQTANAVSFLYTREQDKLNSLFNTVKKQLAI